MSDFLARLAVRAMGSDTSLVPRLPSLFEPLQRTPIMVLPDAGDTPTQDVDKAPGAPPGLVAARRPAAHAAEAPPRQAAHVAPVIERKGALEPAQAASTSAEVAAKPSRVMAGSLRRAKFERLAAPSDRVDLSQAQPSLQVQPRQTRIAPDRHEAMPPRAGGLLPAPGKVFAAPHALLEPARSGRTATPYERNAQPGGRTGTIGEPVVHVSIGRLEVRAAPAAGTLPARRSAGPQPASLDDYLRQRGDKVSP